MGKHGRYVAGGGCLSVGAAGGFTQGGGFGIWSKKFGTAAGNMPAVFKAAGLLIVAADGKGSLRWKRERAAVGSRRSRLAERVD